MSKPTTRQRIEQMVDKEYRKWLNNPQGPGWLSIAEIVAMQEHRRVRAMVRKLMIGPYVWPPREYDKGYRQACDDILKAMQ